MTAKRQEILYLLTRMPENPSYAAAFDQLRPLYLREVAPIIAQYGHPPRPLGNWRRDITGAVEAEEQMRVRISKAELLSLMQPLPPDASAAEVIDEAMYQLVLSYSIDKACQNVADGMGISRQEVNQRMPILAG